MTPSVAPRAFFALGQPFANVPAIGQSGWSHPITVGVTFQIRAVLGRHLTRKYGALTLSEYMLSNASSVVSCVDPNGPVLKPCRY